MKHYIPCYSLNGPRGTQLTICGLYVDPRTEHVVPPTCPDCLRAIAEDEASLAAFAEEDAAKVVRS